jgi:tRNA-2-methylthio-N6-dimethylallyladenosine synthase
VTRGREVSRPREEILTECQKAVQAGALEITLIGQNVDSYQKSSEKFAELLAEVASIPGLKRVRFMSSHPKDLSPAVMDVMAFHPNIERHLHLAVQHGDDEILEKMNRGYTAADFLKKIQLFRKKVPGATVTTDLIVGFPGETEKAFEKLVQFYKKADFDFAFISRYSPRRGTASAKLWPDDVPHEVKAKRWNELNELLLTTTNNLLQKRVGQTLEILVERSESGVCSGRSSEFIFTKFPGPPELVGTLQKVQIQLAKEIELIGHRLN